MIQAYTLTSPTISEISSYCQIPKPFMAPTSFTSGLDSSQPYFACTDFNQFTCVPEICQLYAASRQVEIVSDDFKMVDSKIRELITRINTLKFSFSILKLDADFNTASELLRKLGQDKETLLKVSRIYRKAVDQAWNCLVDPKAYLSSTKHMESVKIFRLLQQSDKLFSTANNMVGNLDNMQKYVERFNYNQDTTVYLSAAGLLLVTLLVLTLLAKNRPDLCHF